MSYSTTKGVVATLVLALVDGGVFDYDDPVAKYWPEFAAAGKERVTIRHILSHQAGLHDVRTLIDHADRMLDWEFMTHALAAAPPAYEPGTRPGYHGLTFGWLAGELVRRVTRGTVNDALRTLLAVPLALDGAFIGAPLEVRPRLAQLLVSDAPSSSPLRLVTSTLARAAWGVLGIDRRYLKAALLPRGSRKLFSSDKLLDAEVPALNGVFTARSLARVYAVLAEGGQLEGTRFFSEATIRRATQIQSRKLDAVVGFPMRWRLGYHTVGTNRGILPHAFGHFGYGGSALGRSRAPPRCRDDAEPRFRHALRRHAHGSDRRSGCTLCRAFAPHSANMARRNGACRTSFRLQRRPRAASKPSFLLANPAGLTLFSLSLLLEESMKHDRSRSPGCGRTWARAGSVAPRCPGSRRSPASLRAGGAGRGHRGD